VKSKLSEEKEEGEEREAFTTLGRKCKAIISRGHLLLSDAVTLDLKMSI